MLLAPVVHKWFNGLGLWLTPFEVTICRSESLYHRLTAITRLQDRGSIIIDEYKVNFARGTGPSTSSVTLQTYTLPNGKMIEPPSLQRVIVLRAPCAEITHVWWCEAPGGNI